MIVGEMLDWYLSNGLMLEDISIKEKLEYSKSVWLKSYVEFNIRKRKEAKTNEDEFGAAFFKVWNIAIYGKTIEKIYNRQYVEFLLMWIEMLN